MSKDFDNRVWQVDQILRLIEEIKELEQGECPEYMGASVHDGIRQAKADIGMHIREIVNVLPN